MEEHNFHASRTCLISWHYHQTLAQSEYSLEMWEGKVSHMISLRYLNFVLDQQIAFDNMLRLLKTGGELVLLFPSGADIYQYIEKVTQKPKWRPYFIDTILVPEAIARQWDKETYEVILEEIGFTVIEVSDMTTESFVYPSEELFKVVMVTNSWVAAVAEWYGYRTVACLVTSSSPVPLKTRRVGQRCTLNLSRAETSSRWCGVVVRGGVSQLGCRPRHLTMVQNYVVRRQKPSCRRTVGR
ncbi:uncharacterized protein TNCV_1953261 [Trichonephila clavipes]|nr:uncharacterized protein TNCV_1953261 [Trichonephila clavipes]